MVERERQWIFVIGQWAYGTLTYHQVAGGVIGGGALVGLYRPSRLHCREEGIGIGGCCCCTCCGYAFEGCRSGVGIISEKLVTAHRIAVVIEGVAGVGGCPFCTVIGEADVRHYHLRTVGDEHTHLVAADERGGIVGSRGGARSACFGTETVVGRRDGKLALRTGVRDEALILRAARTDAQ